MAPTESFDATSWLLTKTERGNPRTRLDDCHPDEQAWSRGNQVRPLIHGASYYRELHDAIEATRPGDLVLFTDWQGDADERLTGEPGSEIAEVLCRADERGVDVRGLLWRSHREQMGFTAGQNRQLARELQERGAQGMLDMRVRTGGSHHQKFVVIRHQDDPARDVAFIGGMDLCHSRRDDHLHGGDPQPMPMAPEYGHTPPWHDIQAVIHGPAVHDVETVFRERWEDPTKPSRSPLILVHDRLRGLHVTHKPLPPQAPAPPPVEGGTHAVQLLRTYPNLRHGRDYEFARGGERSVARGYSKAIERARRLVYLEDQYLWGHHVGNVFTRALRDHPELRVIAVVPMYTDKDGWMARRPQQLGRRRAMMEMLRAAPDRFAVYGVENPSGTPIYVHAKVCIADDIWTTVGSDNFNRRSWTHDSELTAAVVDEACTDAGCDYARDLRLALAAEHLDREPGGKPDPATVPDCVDPAGMYAAFAESADRLDAWYDGGQRGPRPPGRLRRMSVPRLGPVTRALATVPYLVVHDPDGRPRPLRRADRF